MGCSPWYQSGGMLCARSSRGSLAEALLFCCRMLVEPAPQSHPATVTAIAITPRTFDTPVLLTTPYINAPSRRGWEQRLRRDRLCGPGVCRMTRLGDSAAAAGSQAPTLQFESRAR